MEAIFGPRNEMQRNAIIHRALFQPQPWLNDEIEAYHKKHFTDGGTSNTRAVVVGAHLRMGHPGLYIHT